MNTAPWCIKFVHLIIDNHCSKWDCKKRAVALVIPGDILWHWQMSKQSKNNFAWKVWFFNNQPNSLLSQQPFVNRALINSNNSWGLEGLTRSFWLNAERIVQHFECFYFKIFIKAVCDIYEQSYEQLTLAKIN